jgi:hypothetical protein
MTIEPLLNSNNESVIAWKEDELGKAADELKARIRATPLDEAKLSS